MSVNFSKARIFYAQKIFAIDLGYSFRQPQRNLKGANTEFSGGLFSLVQFKIEKFLLEAPFMVIYMTDFPGFCEKVQQNTNLPHNI